MAYIPYLSAPGGKGKISPLFAHPEYQQPKLGLYNYSMLGFTGMGQDSYTEPPAQSDSTFEQLLNVMPSVDGIIRRRRGYERWADSTHLLKATRAYRFQSDATSQRSLVLTASDASGTAGAANNVNAYDELGNYVSNIFTPVAGAYAPRMCYSRDYGYFTDGEAADLRKWDGTSLTKWGIDAPTEPVVIDPVLSGASQSFPLSACAAASAGNTTYTGTGLDAINAGTSVAISGFTNASNNGTFQVVSSTSTTLTVNNPSGVAETASATAQTENSFYPTTLLNGWGPDAHVGDYEGGVDQGFNFGLNAATTLAYTSPSNAFDGDGSTFAYAVQQHTHQYAGCVWSFATPSTGITNPVLNILSEVPASGTDGYIVTLRSAGIWYSLDGGSTWTEIYNLATRAKQWDSISLPTGQDISKVQVMAFMDSHDDMYHKVYEINIQAAAVGSGPITLVSGRLYYAAFENSTSGHISDVSPVSQGTGAVAGGSFSLTSLPVSTDPQVDTLLLLATADGGDETTLYLLASLPNGTTTYSDSMPEDSLLLQPVYQDTDELGNPHGCIDNTPPLAAGTYPTAHRGRLYMGDGQLLVFSKSLFDVTTETGVIAGKWEESWPADYSMDIAIGAETVRGLLSNGYTLYIGTERHIRQLIGDGPSNYDSPSIVFNEVGLLNQEVWQRVFIEGQPTGAMWLTPDLRVIGSDFNTYRDVGTPIQDVLDSANRSAVQSSAWASFFSDGVWDLYVLAIPTGANTSPDTLCVYDLRTNSWAIWQPTDSLLAGLFNIDASGQPYWYVSAASGEVYQFVDGVTADRSNETPVTYAVSIRTPWLPMGDSTIRKWINWIEVSTDDTAMTLDVEGATDASDFASPHSVVSGASLATSPFGQLKAYVAADPANDRFYRLTFHSTAAVDKVLSAWEAELVMVNRF